MSIKEFRLDRKSAGAHCLRGLWGPKMGDLVYDVSATGGGKANHATRAGGEPRSVPSERGHVMLFDGVNDAYASERGLDLGGPTGIEAFTVMAWVWLDSTVPQVAPGIMSQGAFGGTEWILWIGWANIANANLWFSAIGISCEAPLGSFHAVKNQWVHVAASRQMIGGGGGTVSIYQNGVLMDTDPTALNNVGTAKVLQIGSGQSEATRWFKGMIDDVRYYNRGMSIAEIHHVYQTTRYHPYADIMLRPTRRLVHRHRGEVI